MHHTAPIIIELAGGLLLLCRYAFRRNRLSEVWLNRTVGCIGLTGLIYGIIGVFPHWHHFGLPHGQLAVLASLRPLIGGIAVGLFLSLILSGQIWTYKHQVRMNEIKS
ncbi:MAG: hypothetical protein Q7J98_04140 [Kiritimatiellia bacterium]|nr:hypothetical protein [Kiritimatiellia bacterium]